MRMLMEEEREWLEAPATETTVEASPDYVAIIEKLEACGRAVREYDASADGLRPRNTWFGDKALRIDAIIRYPRSAT